MKRCKYCGNWMNDKATVCSKCHNTAQGKNRDPEADAARMKPGTGTAQASKQQERAGVKLLWSSAGARPLRSSGGARLLRRSAGAKLRSSVGTRLLRSSGSEKLLRGSAGEKLLRDSAGEKLLRDSAGEKLLWSSAGMKNKPGARAIRGDRTAGLSIFWQR